MHAEQAQLQITPVHSAGHDLLVADRPGQRWAVRRGGQRGEWVPLGQTQHHPGPAGAGGGRTAAPTPASRGTSPVSTAVTASGPWLRRSHHNPSSATTTSTTVVVLRRVADRRQATIATRARRGRSISRASRTTPAY